MVCVLPQQPGGVPISKIHIHRIPYYRFFWGLASFSPPGGLCAVTPMWLVWSQFIHSHCHREMVIALEPRPLHACPRLRPHQLQHFRASGHLHSSGAAAPRGLLRPHPAESLQPVQTGSSRCIVKTAGAELNPSLWATHPGSHPSESAACYQGAFGNFGPN